MPVCRAGRFGPHCTKTVPSLPTAATARVQANPVDAFRPWRLAPLRGCCAKVAATVAKPAAAGWIPVATSWATSQTLVQFQLPSSTTFACTPTARARTFCRKRRTRRFPVPRTATQGTPCFLLRVERTVQKPLSSRCNVFNLPQTPQALPKEVYRIALSRPKETLSRRGPIPTPRTRLLRQSRAVWRAAL